MMLWLLACDAPDAVRASDPAPAAPPVVIVGAGVAGLATAGALGRGVLLEADTTVGGRALWSGGAMQFVGVPPQAELGFEDDPERAAADWEALTGAPASEATVRYLAGSSTTYDRLLDAGVRFVPTVGLEPLTGAPRMFTVDGGGPALAEALHAALPADVDVRLATGVEGLVWNEGRVVGVRTIDEEIAASEVVIASGGFAGDLQRLAEVAVAEVWEGTNHGGTGDALAWAEAAGLPLGDTSTVGWFTRRVGATAADGGLIALDSIPWVWVDASGERFIDESQTQSVTLAGPLRRAEDAWAIAARAHAASSVRGEHAADFEAAIAADEHVHCRHDVGTLAAAIGVDSTGLVTTVGAIDAVIRGAQDPFGRLPTTFSPLTGELCAWRPGETASKTYGGLVVDADGRVLDAAGEAVPGLWAVGEAAGMGGPGLAGRHGFDGTLSAVVWSGWRVGDRLRGSR